MGIVKRQSITSGIATYLGTAIGYFNIAFLFPKFFDPEHLGLRSVLLEFSMILVQISLFGFTAVVNKFFPYFRNEDKKHNGFLFFVLLIPTLSFLIFATIILIYRDFFFATYQSTSPLINQYYFLIFPMAFFMLLTSIMEVYVAFYNTFVSNFLREVILRILTTVLIILFVFNFISLDQFWKLFAASFAVSLILLLTYTSRLNQLHFKPDFSFLNRSLLNRILNFSFFSWFTGAASMVVTKIDIVMVTYMLKELKETGIYALALYISTVIEVPRRMLSQVISPLLSSAFKNEDMNTVKELYQKSSLNQMIIGGLLFLGLWLNIDQLLELIPKSEVFKEGKYVIFFIGLAKLVDMSTGVNGEIINYSKYYRFGLISVVFLALITILLNFIFIPDYGLNGAAFATFLAFLIFNIVKFIFLKFKFKLQPFTMETVQVLAIGGITYLVVYFMPKTEIIFFDLVINSTLIFFLFLVPIIYLRISPDLTEIIEQKLKFLNFRKK